jgi:bile acid:Na+ symporter, BASS family
MTEILLIVAQVAMLVFLLASMLELGLSLTFGQVVSPLRNARLVLLSLVANFVLVPLVAVGIARVVRLEEPFAIGLLLLGLAPGAPFIPKVVQLAQGNLAFSVGLMVLLMVGTVVCLPLVLPRILVGTEVSPWKIAQPLLFLMLLPLVAGLVVHMRFKSLPAWLCPTLGRLSNLSGLVVVLLIVAVNFKSVLRVFGTGAVFAGLLFVLLSMLAGWLLGGSDPLARSTLGLGTGARNVAAALLVAAQNFKDPKVSVMVIVTALVSLLILLPAARALGKRAHATAALSSKTLNSHPG